MLVLYAGLGAAALSDLRWRRVPNALNGTIVATGLVARVHLEGLGGALDAALGLAGAFALMLGPFALGLYRGGDAKLLCSVGVWLGPSLVAWAFAWGVALGGLVAMMMLLTAGREQRARVRGNLERAARSMTLPEIEPGRPARLHVPMAIAFSAGTIVALAWRF